MKKSLMVALVSFWAFTVFAQQTEVRKIGSFQGIKASNAIDVYLKKGDSESVKVESSASTIPNVVTEVSGSYLKVHMRSGNYNNRSSVKVYVTYVSVNKIYASSAANVFSDGAIKSEDMELSVSSAGSIEIKAEAGTISAEASSAGNITLEGKVKKLSIEVSSAGDVDAYNMDCEAVVAEVSSAGSAKVSVTKDLEANASSGGTIKYRGNPVKTNTNSSSGGSVKKAN